MTTKTAGTQVYHLNIGGPEFKEQRALLEEIIGTESHKLGLAQLEALEGIQGLCDEIADQAHDNYGLDTIITSDAGTNDITTISIYNPETDEVEQVDPAQFEAWQQEVSEANTVLGFMEWREHQQEAEQDEKEAGR